VINFLDQLEKELQLISSQNNDLQNQNSELGKKLTLSEKAIMKLEHINLEYRDLSEKYQYLQREFEITNK
jgi:cell division septum initiation protein DivIVA